MPDMSLATHNSLPLTAAPKYDPPPPGPMPVQSVGMASNVRGSNPSTATTVTSDKSLRPLRRLLGRVVMRGIYYTAL